MDSPTANMFNNLSPIKLISSMSSSQAFDNIDVPSPHPVFATPQNCTMKSKRWKRFQILTSSVLQNSFQEDAVHIAESLEYPDINDHCFPMPAAQSDNCSYKDSIDVDNSYICDHHSHNQLCRSPSSGVNEFLSIPFEDCGNISGSSSMLMGEDDGLICDKEVIFVSSSGDSMTCPSNAFVQVPLIKSASMVTNFVAECTDHSKLVSTATMDQNKVLVSTATMDQNKVLVSTATMDQNKVILPETFQNSYALHEGSGKELLVSNIGESFDFNVSPYNPDKNLYTKKASQQTESASFEEIGTGGTLDKALEVNLISSLPSITSAEHEPIAIDRDRTNHSVVPSNTSCNSANHEVVCSSISSSCFLGKHEGNLYSSWKDYLSQLDHYIDTDCEKNTKTSNGNHSNSSVMRDVSVNSQIPNDQEDAVYHSRCMYKRLLFENIEKHEPSIAYNANSMNLESSLIISNTKIDGLQASNANTNTISERVMALQPTSDISCNYLVKPDSSDQNKGISSAIILKSSGIGLHLNAIGVSGQMSSHLNAEKPMNGSNRVGKTLLRPSCEVQSQVLKNMSVSRNADGEVSDQFISKLDDSSFGSKGECKNERSKNLLDSIPDCSSPNEVISLNMHMQHDFNDHHLTPCGRKCLPSEEAIKSEDSTQSSLRKKRRKASEIEGQKHCSCKRSKCLKLYCDCFAAGLFCNEACGCQVCFNKSEHEEMVSSTRQLIETRNPLAFAPRVVQANGDLKENADNKHITPPSARHKRGCNCKRSKCLKKYCECFQAGVGCSLGCRCEGCRNAFGTKEAYGDITEIVVEHQKPKDDALSRESSAKSLEVTDGKAKLFNAKQFNGCFTPPASLVQGTKSRLQICASYHSISDSNLTALTSLESPTSTMNLKSESPHVEKCEDPPSIVTYQQLDSCSASMFSSPTPQWNGFTSTGNINPSSAPSSALLGVSLQQPRSPVLIQSHFGEEKFSIRSATTTGSDYNLAEETPDILKNDHSPIRTVKVSSPNKKRVSPPKNMGSCFSPGLKSGRKYVLQSISQFPSLTPYRNNLKDESTTGSLEEQG